MRECNGKSISFESAYRLLINGWSYLVLCFVLNTHRPHIHHELARSPRSCRPYRLRAKHFSPQDPDAPTAVQRKLWLIANDLTESIWNISRLWLPESCNHMLLNFINQVARKVQFEYYHSITNFQLILLYNIF